MDIHAINDQFILYKLAKNCPRAIITYINCVNRQDSNGEIVLTRRTIKDAGESWAKFCNDLQALSRENFLSWEKLDKDKVAISMIDVTDDEVVDDD